MKTVKKYRFLHRRFPVNYLKYFRTAFLGNTFQRLLPGMTGSVGHVQFKSFTLKQNFTEPFYGWGSTVSRLQSLYEETVYFLLLGPQDFLVLS